MGHTIKRCPTANEPGENEMDTGNIDTNDFGGGSWNPGATETDEPAGGGGWGTEAATGTWD